ncbi:MAG TPA: hypothetical protein VH328_01260 [Burkholderiaceae bacterium]|jgi:hypothetical protein|nr:hypothetical protein [Burkholderiaceae bacterium]
MNRPPLNLLLAALTCIAALPAHADSFSASSASDSVSASMAKLSDSVTDSSTSSSPGQHRAEGDYRVIDVAEVPDRPTLLRLHLQPLPEDRAGTVDLTLPRAAVAAGQVELGGVVTALARPYGIEFATGTTHAPFFLALDDAWMREMRSNPVASGT